MYLYGRPLLPSQQNVQSSVSFLTLLICYDFLAQFRLTVILVKEDLRLCSPEIALICMPLALVQLHRV